MYPDDRKKLKHSEMPNKRKEIMEIRRILRLYQSGKSKRFIAEYLGIFRNTVNKYLDLVVLCGQSLEVLLQKSDQNGKSGSSGNR